jgi:hypothetical protein
MPSALAMMCTDTLPLVAAFLMAVGVALVLWGAMGALATHPAIVHAADAPAPLRVALAVGGLVFFLVAYLVAYLAYYLGCHLLFYLVLDPAASWLYRNFPYLTTCLIVALSAGAVWYLAIAWRTRRSRPATRVSGYDRLLEPLILPGDGMAGCHAALHGAVSEAACHAALPDLHFH